MDVETGGHNFSCLFLLPSKIEDIEVGRYTIPHGRRKTRPPWGGGEESFRVRRDGSRWGGENCMRIVKTPDHDPAFLNILGKDARAGGRDRLVLFWDAEARASS